MKTSIKSYSKCPAMKCREASDALASNLIDNELANKIVKYNKKPTSSTVSMPPAK